MADLKTIIRMNQEDLKRQMPVEQAVQESLGRLGAREAEVLAKRYGLTGEASQTLQQIGEEYGVTRERVRQIENQGIKKFSAQLETSPLSDLVAILTTVIHDHGGVISQEVLLGDFLPESQRNARSRQCLSFLIERLPEAVLFHGDKHLAAFYARSQAHVRAVGQLVPAAVSILEEAGKPLSTDTVLGALEKSEAKMGVSYLMDEDFIDAILDIGKPFVATSDGQWGLASWPDINPRNIREKTLFVLKKSGTPLHFKEITELIENHQFDHKRVTVQAVHNELINGDEFILIGRGIYALREWGYLPGTVSEVIQAILTKAGKAMDREEIIAQVLQQRHVSRNTIIINLQEKSVFDRVDKTSYKLAASPVAAPQG